MVRFCCLRWFQEKMRSRRTVVPRKPGDDERWTAAVTAPIQRIDERRNPVRSLPDPKSYPEISCLGKGEIKKDLRDLERDVMFGQKISAV